MRNKYENEYVDNKELLFDWLDINEKAFQFIIEEQKA